MFKSSYLRKSRIFGIFLSLIFILGTLCSNPAVYAAYTEAVSGVHFNSPGYIQDDPENSPGGWNIRKFGRWSGGNKATVDFYVDHNLMPTEKKHDIILIDDVSGSMEDYDIAQAKAATAEFVRSIKEKDPEAKVAIIQFAELVQIVTGFTDIGDEDEYNRLVNTELPKIQMGYTIGLRAQTNYYDAYRKVEELLEGYTKREGRDVMSILMTDGCPTVNRNLQVGVYERLKEKYPFYTNNTVLFGSQASSIFIEVLDISDTVYHVNSYAYTYERAVAELSEAYVATAFYEQPYEKFQVVDYVDTEYFRLNSADDVHVNVGSVEVEEMDGELKKIIWTIDDNFPAAISTKPQMTINLELKENHREDTGAFFPTNTGEEVKYKIKNQEEQEVTSELTPVLPSANKVTYYKNAPDGTNERINTVQHTAHSNFNTESESEGGKPTFPGYTFKGWGTSDIENGNLGQKYTSFSMPEKDVDFKAMWGKFDIEKTMDGTLGPKGPAYFMSVYNGNGPYAYGSKFYNVMRDSHSQSIMAFNRVALENVPDYVKNPGNPGFFEIQAPDSPSKIWVWMSGEYSTTMNWASEADEIYLPADCTNMFASDDLRLGTLDLSYFKFDNVTNINKMFNSSGYTALQTIYVPSGTDLSTTTGDDVVFYSTAYSLKGGSGTRLGDQYSNANYLKKQYAKVDGGTSDPGYFTAKTNS